MSTAFPAGVTLAIVLLLMAIKSIYLGADSANNYAHVWYISENIFHGSLPLHVRYLENGNALTYPYGFIPWTLAAILRPLLGDYAVTWVFVLGIILVLWTVYRNILERRPWLLAMFIVWLFFLESILSFQMAFMWSLFFVYLYVGALEKRKPWQAFLWFLLAAGTHVLITGLILAMYNAWVFIRNPQLRSQVAWITALGFALLIPEMWYVTRTPALSQNSFAYVTVVTIATLAARGALFAWPLVLRHVSHARLQRFLHPALAGVLAVAAGMYVLPTNSFSQKWDGFDGLVMRATNDYQEYFTSEHFSPGAVYRVMEANDREQGQYFFIQHGAILSNEFFGESMNRRKWSVEKYEAFLAKKDIDYVVLNRSYRSFSHTSYDSELHALDVLMNSGKATLIYHDPHSRFFVVDVHRLHELTAQNSPSP